MATTVLATRSLVRPRQSPLALRQAIGLKTGAAVTDWIKLFESCAEAMAMSLYIVQYGVVDIVAVQTKLPQPCSRPSSGKPRIRLSLRSPSTSPLHAWPPYIQKREAFRS